MRVDVYTHMLSNQIQTGYHLFCVGKYSQKIKICQELVFAQLQLSDKKCYVKLQFCKGV